VSGRPTNPEATEQACEFGCGPDDGVDATLGYQLVQICPVHGWMMSALDALLTERDALKKERDTARTQVERYRSAHANQETLREAAEATLTRYRNERDEANREARLEYEARCEIEQETQRALAGKQERIEALQAERDEAAARIASIEADANEIAGEANAETVRLARLRLAARQAMRELGVPGPDYPAPVANAWEILRAALDGPKEGA